MNPITALDAQRMIVSTIHQHLQYVTSLMAQGKQIPKFYTEIENVGFYEILSLWLKLKTDKKRLFMPGDLENDRITIVYMVTNDFVIQIESEPCFKLKAKEIDFKTYHFN